MKLCGVVLLTIGFLLIWQPGLAQESPSLSGSEPLSSIRRYDPDNPLSPVYDKERLEKAKEEGESEETVGSINRFDPENPFNPLSKFRPDSPLNPIYEFSTPEPLQAPEERKESPPEAELPLLDPSHSE
jgi:hypothetical protein